jgi:hypothetical protein
MKHIIIPGATLLLGSLISASVTAEFEGVSGADLKKICASYIDIPSTTSDGMCIGFVTGVMSVMEYINILCLPDESTHAQATLVVQRYLSYHPGKLHLNAEGLVIDAIEEAFPCNNISSE